jgi:hypothetical protein
MSSGGSDLLFDQIEIVEQPLTGRRNATVRLYRGSQKMTGFV